MACFLVVYFGYDCAQVDLLKKNEVVFNVKILE